MTAFRLFFGRLSHSLPTRNIITTKSSLPIPIVIAALCRDGRLNEAVHALHNIHGIVESSTYVYLLQCCITKKALNEGKRIHALILNRNHLRFTEGGFLRNTLLQMYVKCGGLVDARVVFEGMFERDVFSWNVMITAYRKQGLSEEALALFCEMQRTGSGVQPDEFTFASVLPACISSASLEDGIGIHRSIIVRGFHSDVVVTNALIDMYSKFGNIEKARVLFDKMQLRDTISWTAMIVGYAQNGFHEEALEIFEEMQRSHVVSDVVVTGALVDMFAKFGNMQKAHVLFDKMQQRDTISWTAMITGYAQNGYGLEALKCFQKMQLTGFRPDSITFASIIPVCATFAALKWGMDIHAQITRCGFLSHTIVITALIDMYSKCGSIKKAVVLFDKMHNRQTISWNAMIAGYARNGHSKEAIKLFEQMEYVGISPDDITLVSVLSACNHAGLVEEGYQYFKSMNDYYHITPTMKHYTCMVDLLGRAGHLDEAKDFINSMPIKPDATVWTCLLGACRIHNNQQLAEFVAEHLLQLDSQNSLPYVLLSNIYAISGRWNQIENVRKMMKDRGIRKLPGCSWIVVNTKVHAFFVGDRSHPKTEEIYRELERLSQVMKAVGYVPDTSFVLQDVKEEEKEQILCHHSEKLAIAFGLLNTSSGTSIRVVKNLRVCGNCHSATKFLSKIVEREIVVRDATRFHHFKEG